MMEFHSAGVLEFPRVLALAARHAASERGGEWLLGRTPTDDPAEAARRLDLTAELRRLLVSAEGFPSLDIPDVRATLGRLDAVGSVLDAPELRDLARLARAAREVRDRLHDQAADFPLSATLAAGLTPAPHFERAVDDTFDEHGEIKDSASPKLRQIRRQTRQQRDRILDRLESFRKGDAGSERTVTLRADRYVLTVRSAEKGEIGGIVHDRSGSGATVYLEPVGLLDDNNHLIELIAGEREEIRRILAALSDLVRGFRPAFADNAGRLAELDGHKAMARLAESQGAIRPALAVEAPRLHLRSFRHPLLLAAFGSAADGARRAVVPLDLELTPERRLLLITGPNMGGKTVAMKGVGLACLMAATGFHLPAADGTVVPVIARLTADIGDEQSIEQDLSTFASHLRRWIEATRQAGPGSLALLDEIGAGTDPAEGAALARAVLERIADGGGLAVTTTHLGALKKFASEHPGVANGSMRFDPVTEQPLYQLDQGLPGLSRAIEMARRLGLDAGLLQRASELIGREERDVQVLLTQLERTRRELENERQALSLERTAARDVQSRYDERRRRLNDEYAALKERGVREGERLLRRAQELLKQAEGEAKDLTRRAQKAQQDEEGRRRLEAVRGEIQKTRAAAEQARPATALPGSPVNVADLRPGLRLWADPLQSWVTVMAPPAAGRVRVERNGLSVELPVSALRTGQEPAEKGAPLRRSALAELPPDEGEKPRGGVNWESRDDVRPEVDLRGLTAEEAIDKLEHFLDDAMLGGVPEVRIIHGKGTGALRAAVRSWLSGRNDILSQRLGDSWEGGAGVTVARLE